MVSPFKIGVDGGGTKTECVLVDARGEVLTRHTASGCNPSHTGPERARAILRTTLGALLAGSKIKNLKSKISATHLYMAGSGEFWRDVAAGLSGFGQVVAAPDSLPVLELATSGAPGLVLHAGTGSFVAARAPDGGIHYAGGLGWRFGDPGSGYDLGRRAIARALLELQGWEAPTRLSEALKAHTGLADARAITRLFYTKSEANAKIASFAPQVIALAAQDDATARLIFAESLTKLADLVDAVLDRLFPSARLALPASSLPPPTCRLPLGVSGAILNSPPAGQMLRALAGTRGWPDDLCFITDPPIEGVRRLLAK